MILLSGPVDYAMYNAFREKLETALESMPGGGVLSIELSTLGGDPEVARMMGEDIRFHSDLVPERRIVLLGKAALYSAGTTFMSFFARDNRYLTRGTRLMIHERKLSKNLEIHGPLTSCIATVEATLNEIRSSIAIQNEGFENLVRGSSVTMDEVLRKASSNWYIEADEAFALGLVAGVL
ncbi:ClpP family protease [Flavisphingomonas formosensis]|uniref:ClpP family protease n=1 Tax=Flavisphingomonas formosensis TaxID=861534 RepID=UPI0012F8E331|nr:ATP-dependent Clp protease proteolytic subunit [Sphingomonas formosensis]